MIYHNICISIDYTDFLREREIEKENLKRCYRISSKHAYDNICC